jgi:hypothetical protein
LTIPKAGAKVRASDWLSAFPTDTDGPTPWTPVVVQGATPTLTVEYAGFFKVGRHVTAPFSLAITGTGTAANAVTVTFPAAAGTLVSFRNVGQGNIFDASASTWYTASLIWASATTFKLQANAQTSVLGVSLFTAALAAGDIVTGVLDFYTSS